MPNPQYLQRAKKVQMYYDPRGQVVRTVNPDATEQWVLFGTPQTITGVQLNSIGIPSMYASTPWESYTFDANDLAPRTHPTGSGVPASHHWTPSSSLLDPLGRTIKTIDRNGAVAADEVVMQYEFDIRGNLLKVTDALNRIAFTHVYDLKPKSGEEDQGANILKTTHIDSGTKTALFDAAYRPTELRDAKGALILHGYDELNRPTRIWARDNDSENVTLRQKLIYGDDTTDGPSTPADTNHLGKLYQHYDEAGLVTLEDYDFKGNVLQKKREVIADSEILSVFNGPPTNWEVPTYRVDWDASPTLEGDYTTDMEYDALNRMKKMVYPEDQDTERKELIPTYNNAGALEKVTMDGDIYVEHIAYNAKGQRLLIAFGNQGKTMTRYVYDAHTFRLSRMKSEKYVKSGWTFEPQSGNTKNDVAYRYDLAGNIVQMIDKTPAAAKGPNDLTRNFSYDPLYRLLSATGRECDNPTPSPPWDDTPRCTDPTATRNYERRYTYDLMGNILQLKHMATGGNFNRDFNYTSATNNHLNSIDSSSTNYAFVYDVNGNMVQELTNRHFEWDHSDQLRAFYDKTGTSEPTVYEHYLYDASGNRLKKITRKNSGSHPYEVTIYVDGIYEKSYKWDGSSGYTEEKNELHIMDDKSRIAMKWIGHDDGTPEVKYILDNHLGSSNTVLEDDAGATVYNREEYFPFGETSFGSFGKKRYRYVGKEKDEYSGLYYYGARYYAPWTCRFISVDPSKEQRSWLTPYNYVQNNPLKNTDSTGALDDGGGGGGDKKGDVITGSDGKEYTLSIDAVEVTAIAPRDKYEKDILNGKISFTANYGWVDNSHAFTDTKRNEPYIGVEALWNQLKDAPSSDQLHMGYYSVNYRQDYVIGNISIGIERQYLVKEGLSLDQRKSVALAIFQDVSIAYEQMQGLASDSSFEPADLPSNMLSFYRAVEGMTSSEIKNLIQPVSPEQSIEVYRSYPGTFSDSRYKQKSFQPRYFASPYTSKNFGVPERLNTIKPASMGSMKDFGGASLIPFDQDLIKVRNW